MRNCCEQGQIWIPFNESSPLGFSCRLPNPPLPPLKKILKILTLRDLSGGKILRASPDLDSYRRERQP